MRSAKITYSNGTVINTSLAANLTDKEINDYFKVGKSFNIGNGPADNMQTVVSCEIAPLMGLIVEVYAPKDRIDCTNGGISSKVNSILLSGEGIPEIFEASADCPAFRLVRRNLSGGEYLHVEPWERSEGSGFFFGSTDYTEYYLKELERTRDVINAELAIEDNFADYYYHSSW
jgi:hypothetical protein